MNVIFAHDHRFIEARGRVWSESQFQAAHWERYLRHFSKITVAGRGGLIAPGGSAARLELASGPDVGFELFPNLSCMRGLLVDRLAVRGRMDLLVSRHDALIARLPSEIGLLAIASARRVGCPWAVEVAGCPWDGLWNYGSIAGRAYAPLAAWRLRRAVARADHVIYVTGTFLQKRYPTSGRNTGTASNVVLPRSEPNVLTARRQRIERLHEQPLRLGMIATLRGRFKGIQTLLAALAKPPSDLPPVELRILGAGDPAHWKAEAARLGVANVVVWEGTLPAGEPVLRWLDAIDIYIQPSLKEGLPRALIEAMSRGCPAIASTAGGIPELLPQDDLVAPGDVSGLIRLLRRRLGDRRWMIERAVRNWNESRKYTNDVLEARRDLFWKAFAREAVKSPVEP